MNFISELKLGFILPLLLQNLPQPVPTGCTWTLEMKACDKANIAPCFTLTPTCPPPTLYEIGELGILPGDDSGNGNLVIAQSVNVIAPAVLSTISFYVTNSSGSLRLGLYDSDCKTGLPGILLAQAELGAVGIGWNTITVTSAVSLTPGTYWLAYSPSSNGLAFKVDRVSGRGLYFTNQYGPMPQIWPAAGVNAITSKWSIKIGVIGQ